MGQQKESRVCKSPRDKSLVSSKARDPQHESGGRIERKMEPGRGICPGGHDPHPGSVTAMGNGSTLVFLGYKITSMINFTFGKGAVVCKTGSCLKLKSRGKHTEESTSSYPSDLRLKT